MRKVLVVAMVIGAFASRVIAQCTTSLSSSTVSCPSGTDGTSGNYKSISSSISQLTNCGGGCGSNQTYNTNGIYTISGSSLSVSLTINNNARGSNASVDIYVCPGQTFTLSGVNNNGVPINVYVLSGGTFIPPTNYQGNSSTNFLRTHVYGTLNLNNNTLNIQNNSQIYIYSSGIVYNGSFNFTGSSSQVINEGLIDLNNMNISSTAAGMMCVNNGGCVRTNAIGQNDQTNSVLTGVGSGYIYYNNTSAPTANSNISSSSALNVCTRESSPSSRWGSATTTASCTSPNSKCINPLPISKPRLSATRTASGAVLSVSYPEKYGYGIQLLIQYSTDGSNWHEIKYFSEKELIQGNSHVTYVDNEPRSGTVYYRIVEKSRKSELALEVASIEFEGFKNNMSVFPNPSTGDISVRLQGEPMKYKVEICDHQGSTVHSYELQTGTSLLPVHLVAGTYFIRITSEVESKIFPIFVY